MNDTDKKKKRAPRRNFEKTLSELKQYCEIKVEVLKSIGPVAMLTDSDAAALIPNAVGPAQIQKTGLTASIEAYEDILARLGK